MNFFHETKSFLIRAERWAGGWGDGEAGLLF